MWLRHNGKIIQQGFSLPNPWATWCLMPTPAIFPQHQLFPPFVLALPLFRSHHNCQYLLHLPITADEWWPHCSVPMITQVNYKAHTGIYLICSDYLNVETERSSKWQPYHYWLCFYQTVLHLQLPNFVSCGRAYPSHMTQNLVTVGAKLWTAEHFLIDPWSMD